MTRWRRFVAVGDSITEGYGMDPVEGVEHLPWAERVARELDVELHNLGYRGLRAAEVRRSQLAPALALGPDLVSVAAGGNDLVRESFDGERLRRDLEPLYSAFAAAGATVFTFTYLNIPASGLLPEDGSVWLDRRMRTLHAVIRDLADEYGAVLVDLYSDPRSANPAFFSRDLQHANAAGQAFVAERTVEALLEHRGPAGRPAATARARTESRPARSAP